MVAAFRLGVIASAISKGAAPTGPTRMLLHFDGANGSTSIIDSSAYAHSVSFANGGQISTAQSKFGGSSALLDGTNDYASVTAGASLTLVGDFTIAGWVRLTARASNAAIITLYGATDANTWELYSRTSSGGALTLYNRPTNVIIGGTDVTVGAWHHVAWTRQGTTHRIFLDGVLQGSYAGTTDDIDPQTVYFGTYDSTVEFLNGHLEEFIYFVGAALYTANFTPPTAPYSDDYGPMIFQFGGSTYTPPVGGAVDPQFSASPYTPPTGG